MFEYKIGLDEFGRRHFRDIDPSSGVDYQLVVHNSVREDEKGYLIGFIPYAVLEEIRVGDRFHSLGMEYVVSGIRDYVYVYWIN